MRAHAPTRRGAWRGSAAVRPRWRASRLLACRRGCRHLPPSILCLSLSGCRRRLSRWAGFLRPPRTRGGRHGAEPCVLRHKQSLATGVANCPGWRCCHAHAEHSIEPKIPLVHRSIDLIQNVDQPGIAETLGMGMHLRERPMDRVRRDPKPRRPPRFSSHRHTRGTWARTLNSPATTNSSTTTNDTRAASQLASPGSSWPSCPSVCCSHQRRTCPAAASACPGTTLPRAGSMSASQAAVLSTTSTALE